MGTIRFHLPESSSIRADRLDTIYMSGIEAMPYALNVERGEHEITLIREQSESGKVFIPVQSEIGLVYVPTGTVIDREEPYRLALELARGTLDRLRNQTDLWNRCGFQFSDELQSAIEATVREFCKAAVLQHEPQRCDKLSIETLDASISLIERLNVEYNRQLFQARKQQTPRLPIVLGSFLPAEGAEDRFTQQHLEALGVYQLGVNWSECEPAIDSFNFVAIQQRIAEVRRFGKQVILGPLVQLAENLLPSFIVSAQDFDRVRSRVVKFVRAMTSQLGDKVDMIDAFGGLNTFDSLALPADYRLRLAIDVIEGVRADNTDVPLFVTFDQPWCEGATGENNLTPLQCADAIVRAKLDVSGFILEINWGLHPTGTLPRDPLQIHTLLDLWSQFELPLFVSFSCPSGTHEDRLARQADVNLEGPVASPDDPDRQLRVAEQMVSLLVAKPYVQGLIWNQLSDEIPHRFRHCGLIDAADKPKPVLGYLRGFQQSHLM